MRKLLLILVLMIAPYIVFAGTTNFDSNAAPLTTNTWDLGTSALKWKAIHISSGINGGIIQSQSWVTPVIASSNTVYSVKFTTTALQGISSTTVAGITRMATSRNVTVSCDFSLYNAVSDTQVVNGNVTINGVDNKGNTVSEIIISSNGTEIAGNVAWSYINSITHNITFGQSTKVYTAGVVVNVGLGTKIGIAGDINYQTDILLVNENGTSIKYNNSSLSINTNYDTIDFVTDFPGTAVYYSILYRNFNIQ